MALAEQLTQPDTHIWFFLAENPDKETLGVISVTQCAAVYAGGFYGEINELYIKPEFRALGMGHQLIESVKRFAADKGWRMLTVTAPGKPEWQRTRNFYQREGFEEIGPTLELSL
ncbi:GNAT family N-acetyltransferase [Endozoicomonas arenosclerae]|uniref:GNAT family N-acetyltransferase n=1 Tax=Endozoicomonas arenosclerae TaxID=1633495 RepID=UPI002480ED65|nr:GNAT family N-acetyltransferase [Endozoicomonas arenosclerae]